MTDWQVTPHAVPPELDPDFAHADPPDVTPHRDPVGDIITAELSVAERVGYQIIDSLDAETKSKLWALIAERADSNKL